MTIQLVPEQPQSFNYSQLSEQEQLEGQVLSHNQKQVLQNQRAVIAEQLIGIEYDPVNPVKFAQDHAFLQGQMAVFKWLLDASLAAEAAILELARRQQEQNSDQQSL